MDLTIRPLQEGDYENILVKWWNDWKWEAPAKDFLPDDGKGGLVVYDGDVPVCAGFLYITNSKVCWVDWIISNKEYREKPGRKIAKSVLIQALTDSAKNSGSKYAYALIKHKGLISTYQDAGYIKADNYNQEMIKAL
jgi:hypothetical protein